jgi:hypothetical protein
MLIILEDQVSLLQGRYVTLELDKIRLGNDGPVKQAYCVVETVRLQDMPHLQELRQRHQSVIEHYRNQNWDDCLIAIDSMEGQFNGELDSFYQDLATRAKNLQQHPPQSDWDPVITKPI